MECFKPASAEAFKQGSNPASADAKMCRCVFDAHSTVSDC